MKTIVIREYGNYGRKSPYLYDLEKEQVKDCTGCWSCWWRTPGRCMHKDLDELYREYLSADRVIIFSKLSLGFVSGNLKTLFDRLIPLVLPYIKFDTGESMHVPRYQRYPEIEVYYEGEFADEEEKRLYREYLERVFYQFHTKLSLVKPVDAYKEED